MKTKRPRLNAVKELEKYILRERDEIQEIYQNIRKDPSKEMASDLNYHIIRRDTFKSALLIVKNCQSKNKFQCWPV